MSDGDCPLCLEPLDPVESNLFPCCHCKFQICLFCLNRLKEEANAVKSAREEESRTCGSCPGCRHPYPADSDDESMAVAVRLTKKRAKARLELVSKDRNSSLKEETRGVTSEQSADNNNVDSKSHRTTTKTGNRRPSCEPPTQARRTQLPADQHRKRSEKDLLREKEWTPSADRWKRGARGEGGRRGGGGESQDRSLSQSHHSKRRTRPVLQPQVRGIRNPASSRRSDRRERDADRAADQKQDATSIRDKSTEEKKQELVSLLSSLGLSPCNIRFHPQRQES